MAERKAGSQSANLTLDHYKSRISLIYLRVGGVPHIVRKLWMRITTLLYTSLQLKMWRKRYGPPKSRDSQFQEFQDSQLGSPWTNWHLDVAHVINHKKNYKREGNTFPQVLAVLNLVSLCVPMVRPCTKNAPTMH